MDSIKDYALSSSASRIERAKPTIPLRAASSKFTADDLQQMRENPVDDESANDDKAIDNEWYATLDDDAKPPIQDYVLLVNHTDARTSRLKVSIATHN